MYIKFLYYMYTVSQNVNTSDKFVITHIIFKILLLLKRSINFSSFNHTLYQ